MHSIKTASKTQFVKWKQVLNNKRNITSKAMHNDAKKCIIVHSMKQQVKYNVKEKQILNSKRTTINKTKLNDK